MRSLHELYRICLEQVGCKVDCAFDGSAAVQMYREKGPYDVVLSGTAHVNELTERIRQTKPEQAIALVGHVGATGCRFRWKIPVLRIPFQREELIRLVESAIKPQTRILLVAGDNCGDLWSLVIRYPSSFDIELESNGEDALRRYRERGPYDLVLTGFWFVPKSSRTEQTGSMMGSDLALAIRRENPSQRVAVITLESSPNVRRSIRRKLGGIPLLRQEELFDAMKEVIPEWAFSEGWVPNEKAEFLVESVDKAIEKQQNELLKNAKRASNKS